MNRINDNMKSFGNEMINMADIVNGSSYKREDFTKALDKSMDSFNSKLDKLEKSVKDRFGNNSAVMDSFNDFSTKALNFQMECDSSNPYASRIFEAQNAARDFSKVADEAAKRESSIRSASPMYVDQPLSSQYKSMMNALEKSEGIVGVDAERRVAAKMIENLRNQGNSFDDIQAKVTEVLNNNSPQCVGNVKSDDFIKDLCNKAVLNEKSNSMSRDTVNRDNTKVSERKSSAKSKDDFSLS